MISKGFFENLESIAIDRHIEKEDVLKAADQALIKAAQAEGHKGEIEVTFDELLKKVRVFEIFHVVSEVDPESEVEGQITLEEALGMRKRIKIGDEIRKEIPLADFTRKGASRFKQILIQSLREIGSKRAFEYFNERLDQVITATIIKVTDKVVVLNLGLDTHSFMPISEGLSGETYITGQTIKVSITKVEETGKGPKVFVTRSNKELIKRLLETNIPEVAQGVVEVISIAREPGSRTKLCVKSTNPNVDACGACLGQNGSRIKQIIAALNGERIEIFRHSDNPVLLIAEALTPAKVISVLVDEDTRKSIVIVPDDQLSLAIGKGGQNARLASQAIGWRIDIKDETSAYRDNIHFKPNVYTA